MSTIPATVLVADDQEHILDSTSEILREEGHHVLAYSPKNPDPAILRETIDVAVLDIIMPGFDGFEMRQEILKHSPRAQFIFITGHPDRQVIDRAIRLGVLNFITKPFTADHIRFAVFGALSVRDLVEKNRKAGMDIGGETLGLVGKSESLRKVREKILELAPLNLPILVTGESGSGKDVAARCIHAASERSGRPFVPVNCAGITASLIESELFGHARGAFTGASTTKRGFFDVADGGTLFLDEIGDMPLELQSRLLRVLDRGEFNRVGEPVTRRVDVRVISATNRNLREMVAAGRFRADLFYRLHGTSIHLQPLRERVDDIAPLANHFLDGSAVITPGARDLLQRHRWPGNVRELAMTVKRLKAGAVKGLIHASAVASVLDIPQPRRTSEDCSTLLPYHQHKERLLAGADTEYFRELLARTGGNISQAAQIAGIDRKSVYRKIRALGLSPAAR